MSDEFALQKKISDAAKAETYLRDEFLQERQEARIAEIFAGWQATNPRDVEMRESLFRQYHEVKKRWDDLIRIAADGRVAQAELDMLEAQRKANLRVV